MPRFDHEVVGRCPDVGERHLGDVECEEPGAAVWVVERGLDLHQRASHLGVAGSRAQVVLRRFQGRTVERDPTVASHVDQLHRPGHHPECHLAVGAELELRGVDPRRAVATQWPAEANSPSSRRAGIGSPN